VNPAAGAASSEVVNWYPHPNVKIANTRSAGATTTYLHRNQLDSVVLTADASGGQDIERIYEPFGADAEYILDVTADNDDIGFIGERKDAVAGLQYLNARYYDPELAMFIQPDWWELTRAGVGTNRYAYSGNDPVNLRDPGGNVPSNPGGSTSTGWTQNENGTESYDSRTDRQSSDYLNQDKDNNHTIGEYNPGFFSKNEYGSPTRTRSNVNSGFYDRDSGYRGAQQDAVTISGSQNMGTVRNTAVVAVGVVSLGAGIREFVGIRALIFGVKKGLGSNPFVGKTAQQIEKLFARNGFARSGPSPVAGRGGYVNPRTGRSFHIDPEDYGKYREPSHVDVNRPRGYKGPLGKRKYEY
jgi:RHS repeat-associated protein